MTIYTLSIENLRTRPKKELDFLLNLARKEIKGMLNDENNFIVKNNVKVNFIGNLKELPNDIKELMIKVAEKTKTHKEFILNLAVAYGGRQEIIDACRKLILNKTDPASIDEKVFRQNLQTNGYGDPDLIVRTGGEKRISNFLLFQSAYSELAFLDCLWPEFSKEDFMDVIEDFSERERRFGG